MLASRALALLRNTISRGNVYKLPTTPMINQTRYKSGWHYREVYKPDKHIEIIAECIGGFMWFWVLYHCWHDWHHLSGDSDYPDPEQWTDEELGVPPDDVVYENFDESRCIVPQGFYDRKRK